MYAHTHTHTHGTETHTNTYKSIYYMIIFCMCLGICAWKFCGNIYSYCMKCNCKWMNEWTNEWMNEKGVDVFGFQLTLADYCQQSNGPTISTLNQLTNHYNFMALCCVCTPDYDGILQAFVGNLF